MPLPETLALGSPFGSHMVLQQGRSNPLWGWDRPGQRVTVVIEGEGGGEHGKANAVSAAGATSSCETICAGDGSFQIDLPDLPAGGPYRLRVRGSVEKVLADVLVGEVWLASGQSNMEWKVWQAARADEEIAAANHPAIRCLYVARATASEPAGKVDAAWRVLSPETVGTVTAVGYFFARDIHRRLGVPVGIIDAAWGGTRVEAWTSLDALRACPGIDTELAERAQQGADIEAIRSRYFARLTEWETAFLPADPGNRGEALGWAEPDFDASDWQAMSLPSLWQAHGLAFNGVVWFRRVIELPASLTERDLVLSLGAIDDFDHTYFNGTKVGAHPKGTPDAYRIPRRYIIPKSLLRPGRNVIAVRVFDHFGEGGFVGPAGAMFVEPAVASTASTEEPSRSAAGSRLPLAGPWHFQVEHRIDLVPSSVFETHPAMPSVLVPQDAPAALFHGMIAPLTRFGLRGVLWYQGESNADAHATYRDRFTALIRDWRTRWGQGQLSFYFVQLAGFVASKAWAHLREAQMQTLAEPGTGMAIAIDVGEAYDIHPRNKQEVARRLALLARRHDYGENDLEASGPLASHVTIVGSEVRIRFAPATGLTTRDGKPVEGFEVAGADRRFARAAARIEGQEVVVAIATVPHPVAVRYAFSDNPPVNLVSGEDLPAMPFRTDAWRDEDA